MWAIVGSSGFEYFDSFEIIEELSRETPFGLCSNGLFKVKIDNQEVLFLNRTGLEQNILPHQINYKANIYALKKYGATSIIALSSVRSLRNELKPGDMVIPYQFIDRTKSLRDFTFCEQGLLNYVSLSRPITESIAEEIRERKADFDFTIHFKQSYVCIEGPQFPTIIDAKCFQSMGGGVIGMTAYPEFALAREAGLNYICCNFIVDYVPWSYDVRNEYNVLEIRQTNNAKAESIIKWLVKNLSFYSENDCHELGIARYLSTPLDTLPPNKRAWLKIIAKDNSKHEKALEAEIFKKVPDLYGGIKAIPAKMQDLLTFISKYDRDGNRRDLESTRRAAASLDLYSYQKLEVEKVENLQITHNDGHNIPVRFYNPDPSRKLQAIVFSHGGGFVSGTLDSFDAFCRKAAITTNRVVFSVDYRLAPEHKFPAGLSDVEFVAEYVYNHAKNFGISKKEFTLMGDSAGANLSILATYNLLKANKIKIANNVILYPSVDLSHMPTKSLEDFASGYILTKAKTMWYSELYVPDNVDKQSPEISPFYIKKLEGMPRTLVITAGFDPLKDEGLLFAERLIRHNVEVQHYHFDSLVHGFINFSKLIPSEMDILHTRITKFLK
ncbi:alpha/beta hydrolase fold domain-containing protein [Allofrancisella guangzhouensis]|uniref:Phosphorylase n=1 Tax=Allofrancisella guangzhouensis TaxID=594679 RepID=A0A0A8E3W0_9GAMM|nr:alpha/beta hydrolase fold domain-containing protein [Allofrancisella guangzhouensis]AJC48915.1 phosphorylase [Allofrancisella guangzhouensis]MBK2027122.1 alpha/beta hydrolase fold domain-containing protein [Allofrancisella guangzhouensis]MBK2043783.1 alpha/beta hydrolase fold domain-containing protein [Allofrancisella guangzhouensis]MBK2045640.1 alpha/beta hydrolase fold domain-containing protein [Allofrancisella guangzhouensis]